MVFGVEGYLCHLFAVCFGVEGSFSEENGVFFRGNTQFVVEGMVPDLLHIVPVGDDAVFDGVLERQNTSLGLGFISDVRVLLSHTDHDALVTGATHDGGEDGAGSIVSGETGLTHTGSIVHNQSCYFVGHFQ